MTTIQYVMTYVMPASFALLPPAMDTLEARAMLLAIGLQESKFVHRVQVRGPARGFWQFEMLGGVMGVLTHPASRGHARSVCETLRYPSNAEACYEGIADNDVLACCFARLLLWTIPRPLPTTTRAGWHDYLSAWRPGKPHPDSWQEYYTMAWSMVDPANFGTPSDGHTIQAPVIG